VKISYGITVKDELNEIKKLLNQIFALKKVDDEVIVIFDKNNGSKEVKDYLQNLQVANFNLHEFAFNDDFSELKNFLISKCSGEYIFNIDADEFLTEQQHKNIINTLEKNKHIEAFLLPRINILEGLTEDYIKENNIILNEKGWLNYPDYQTRIFKKSLNIRWINKIHESLIGAAPMAAFPPKEEFSLLHIKTVERQEKQHQYYIKKFYNKENN
jgi:hypothetical protein